MSEPRYLDTNPWPATDAAPVLFILDAGNRVEQGLLESWLQKHRPEWGDKASQVSIPIGSGEKSVGTRALQQALDASPDTLVVPLRVTWLPPEEYFDSGPRLRHLLLGDPRRPGALRGRRILRKQPQRVNCIAGAAATIVDLQSRGQRRLGNDAPSPEAFADFVVRQAGLTLEIAERQLQGGRYKVPRFVTQSLLASPGYREAVENIAQKESKSLESLWREAQVYMKEMISNPRRFYVDFYSRFNNYVLGLGYEDQLVYDKADIERMRNWVRQYPSMLLWTHKTYLDGMVAPKVLYDNDFPLPHMFGGANMSFLGLGFLLRRSGGIFIRRSFQDNELYKATLKHYIGYLMDKRFPMHWALEGTRSRLGKLMPPRYGLLKYVLEACDATDAENIHIIPISISFDLIRDVEEYAGEQTGRVKQAESLSWFIGYVRSLARPMGRAYMDIGEPVVLEKAPDPDDRLALSKIAFQVAVEINRVTPITLPSLVTMALLGSAPQALTTAELVTETQALLDWASERGIRKSDDFDPEHSDHVRNLLNLMIDENVITRYDEGPEVVYGIALEQHPVASYYRNTIIHHFVNKAIIELALLKVSESGEDNPIGQFWEEVDQLRDLFKFEFFYSATDEFHREIRTELERSYSDWEDRLRQGSQGFIAMIEGLTPFVAHTALLTFVEAYRVVAELLARLDASEALEQKACVNQALKYGKQAYLQRRISSEASIGKILFQNAYKLMQNLGLTEAGEEDLASRRRQLAQDLRKLALRLDRIKAIATAQRVTRLERE
jgi:glycerol-3-phosphate O-acyltransferase